MYTAYVNGENFFDTSLLDSPDFLLTSARVEIEAGSAGSFDFTIPQCNRQAFSRLVDVIDIYRDTEPDPFWTGRVYSIKETLDGQRQISCEGALAFLNDSVYRQTTYSGGLHALVQDILESHNDQTENRKHINVGNLTIANSDVYRAYQTYESSISRLKDLVDSFGGHLMIRRTSGQLYLDWLDDFTTPCTQEVEFGSNILDITRTIDSNDIATMILPLGAKDDDGKRLTIADVNSGLDYISADTTALVQYGYIMKVVIWDDVTDASALKQKAQDYLTACLVARADIRLNAVDLKDAGYSVDHFCVGQKISVTVPAYDINAELFSCCRQNLDLLHPESNKLELGEIRTGYISSQRVSMDKLLQSLLSDIDRSKTVLQQAIDIATKTITGNEGGYVVLHDSNSDGYPDEILIMDTPSITTAVKVWRWNNSGLGYSSTGYNGTYGTAITMDGRIVADFITTGTLLADRIQGGTLTLGGYNNQYGTLLMKNASGQVIQRNDNGGTNLYDDRGFHIGTIYAGTFEQSSETVGHVMYSLFGDRLVLRNDYYCNTVSLSSKSGLSVDNDYGHHNYLSRDKFHMESTTELLDLDVSAGLEFYFLSGDTYTPRCKVTASGEIRGSNLYMSGTKTRVVSTDDYADRLLYCYETPSPLFGDVGEGVIGDDGICYVWLDPVLQETITTEQYQVFLQTYGQGEAHILSRAGGYFVVSGTPGLSFGWELKAKQRGYDQLRLESIERQEIKTEHFGYTPQTTDYGVEAQTYIQTLQEGRVA